MKAIILLGILKEKGTSNTQVLTEFAVGYLEKQPFTDEKVCSLCGRHDKTGKACECGRNETEFAS
jgi:hypothetical protein